MTVAEIREKLKDFKEPQWFKEIEVVFRYRPISLEIKKQGITAIVSYVQDQINGWEKINELPPQFIEMRDHLKSVLKYINVFLTNASGWDINTLNQQWNKVRSGINLISQGNSLPYNSTEVSFLISLGKEKPEYFQGAFDFLVNRHLNITQSNNGVYFTGAFIGYEFHTQNESLVAQRRRAEKKSLESLKTGYEKFVNEVESYVQKFIDNGQAKAEEHVKSIDKLYEGRKAVIDEWFDGAKSSETSFHEESQKRLKGLEDLYNEKLKLEAPAQYWKKRAEALDNDGWLWVKFLIGSAGLAAALLFAVLLLVSTDQLIKIFSSAGSAIRWSVVFITFVSFLAISIRTFSKLAFSAFHLKRDAEEREQLAYVYLALRKDKNIDDTERHLVMQSIFSRADSGLLKDDSAPTMPGNIVDKIMTQK